MPIHRLLALAALGPALISEWAKLNALVITQDQLEKSTLFCPAAPAPVPRLPAAILPQRPALRVIRPDIRGFLDATQPEAIPAVEDPPNPFRKRWRPPEVILESILSATGILVAAFAGDSCVCLNGRICSPGDSFEGFTLCRVAADEIEMRRRHTLLRLPLDRQPWRLRTPKS